MIGGLQTALKAVITNNPTFSRLIKNKSGPPSIKDKIRVALVDLTGKKLLNPEFAGWGSTVATNGWSTIKVAVLYASFQLLNDLRSLRGVNTITDLIRAANGAKFPGSPDISKFLDLKSSPPNIKFSSLVEKATIDIIDNHKANCATRVLISIMGFPYIACVILNSGLYHSNRGGIWIKSSYSCEKNRYGNTKEMGSIMWTRNVIQAPKAQFNHNATALSLATFFTLLAQHRLVNPTASDDIRACLSTASWLTAAFPAAAKIASKVGRGEPGNWAFHETGLIENGRLRYAFAIMTIGIKDGVDVLKNLIVELDKIIDARNP